MKVCVAVCFAVCYLVFGFWTLWSARAFDNMSFRCKTAWGNELHSKHVFPDTGDSAAVHSEGYIESPS